MKKLTLAATIAVLLTGTSLLATNLTVQASPKMISSQSKSIDQKNRGYKCDNDYDGDDDCYEKRGKHRYKRHHAYEDHHRHGRRNRGRHHRRYHD